MKDVVVCVWLRSLITVFSRFIRAAACIGTSFLKRNNISLYGRTTSFYPFITWWTFVMFPPFDACEKCYYEHLCTNDCLNICFNSFGYNPGADLFVHMFNLVRNEQFSTVVAPLCIFTSKVCSLQFLHIPVNTFFFVSFKKYHHSSGYTVVIPSNFDLNFP